MSQFRNLVFEGGGVKGIAYAGAIQELEKRAMLADIKRVAGTSAGAITATLLALGASGADVQDIIGNTKFVTFMDDSLLFIRDTNRLLKDFGWYKGDTFARWMKEQINKFSQKPELTFSEIKTLASKPGSKFRELHVVGTNLSTQFPSVYSAETTPDFPIWSAVRISMSIPLFFASVKLPPNNQILVDGGVSWNYPIDLFDEKNYLFDPKAGEKPKYTTYNDNHIYNKETLGFRISTKDEIAAEKNSLQQPPLEITDFFDYLKAFLGFILDMANKVHLHENDWHRTIFVDAGGVRTTEFDLSQQKIDMLVANGINGAKEYFDWFNDPKATPKPCNKI